MEAECEFEKPVKGLHLLTNDEEVSIKENCIRLVSFPEISFFPNNLRSLKIESSGVLKCLPEEMMGNNSQLESLHVSYCSSLTFIAKSKMPSLKKLEVGACMNLQRLVNDEEGASSLAVSLKYLRISFCPNLFTLSSGIQLLEALDITRWLAQSELFTGDLCIQLSKSCLLSGNRASRERFNCLNSQM